MKIRHNFTDSLTFNSFGNMKWQQNRQQAGEQGYEDHADHGDASASHELFYPQIGVGKRLDGGRRRVKKYLWSF